VIHPALFRLCDSDLPHEVRVDAANGHPLHVVTMKSKEAIPDTWNCLFRYHSRADADPDTKRRDAQNDKRVSFVLSDSLTLVVSAVALKGFSCTLKIRAWYSHWT